jgi:mycofactocin precursor
MDVEETPRSGEETVSAAEESRVAAEAGYAEELLVEEVSIDGMCGVY